MLILNNVTFLRNDLQNNRAAHFPLNYFRFGFIAAKARRASSMARCSGLPYSMQLRSRSSIAVSATLTRVGIWAKSASKTAESYGVCQR